MRLKVFLIILRLDYPGDILVKDVSTKVPVAVVPAAATPELGTGCVPEPVEETLLTAVLAPCVAINAAALLAEFFAFASVAQATATQAAAEAFV